MRVSWVVLVCGLTALPLTASARPSFIVIDGAPLFARPDARSTKLTTKALRPLRVVGKRKGWYTVETFGGGDWHCASDGGQMDARLRLYVRASDALKVTRRPITEKFRDDTSIHLHQGFIVPSTTPRMFREVAARAGLEVTYRPKTWSSKLSRNASTVAIVSVRTALAINGRRFRLAKGREVRRNAGKVEVTDRCARFTGDVPGTFITRRSRGGLAGSFLDRRPRPHLRARTALFWPDGSRAGVLLRDTPLSGAPQRRGNRACAPIEPGWDVPATTLCFAAARIISKPAEIRTGPLAAPPPLVPEPKKVLARALERLRIAGNPRLAPPPAVKRKIRQEALDNPLMGKRYGIVRVCVDRAGKVSEQTLVVRARYPAYNAHIEAQIRRWRFKPYKDGSGNPIPVCTGIEFSYGP